jgi:hypothetical protein
MLLPWVYVILLKWKMPEQPLICPVCGEPYQRVEAVENAFIFYVHGDLPSGEPELCSVAVEERLTDRGSSATRRLDGTPFKPLRGE